MDQLSSVSLPCSRDRHGACAGEFAFGISRWITRDRCECHCHAQYDLLDDQRYGVWGLEPGPRLELVVAH